MTCNWSLWELKRIVINGISLSRGEKWLAHKGNCWGWVPVFMNRPGRSLHVWRNGRKCNANKTEELSFLVEYIQWGPVVLYVNPQPSLQGLLHSLIPLGLKSTQQYRQGGMWGMAGLGFVSILTRKPWNSTPSGKGSVQSCAEPPKGQWKNNVLKLLGEGAHGGSKLGKWCQGRGVRAHHILSWVGSLTACWEREWSVLQSSAQAYTAPAHLSLLRVCGDGGRRHKQVLSMDWLVQRNNS